MVNLVFGSYNARGKKNRRNISRFTQRVPSTAAITKRRRRATVRDSSGSSCLEKIVPIAWNRDGLGTACPAPLGAEPGGSKVVFAIFLSLNKAPIERTTRLERRLLENVALLNHLKNWVPIRRVSNFVHLGASFCPGDYITRVGPMQGPGKKASKWQ